MDTFSLQIAPVGELEYVLLEWELDGEGELGGRTGWRCSSLCVADAVRTWDVNVDAWLDHDNPDLRIELHSSVV